MNETVIFAGKENTKNSKLATIAKQLGLKTLVTTLPQTDSENPSCEWNKCSPLSAKTVILNAEHQFSKLDAVVLFFDAISFNQIYPDLSIENITRSCDEMILAYNYLAFEALNHFEKKSSGKIFFVLQPMQTHAEFLRKSSKDQIENSSFCSLLTAQAQGAFKAFAENFAASKYRQSSVTPIYLLQAQAIYSDQQIVEWIYNKIQEENPVLKNTANAVLWQSIEKKSIISSLLKK